MTKKAPAMAGVAPAAVPAGYAGIHGGIVELLDAARQAAARSVNALMTASYWEIGRRIVEAEQQGERRAGYGEQLIVRLSADLTARFGPRPVWLEIGFGGATLFQYGPDVAAAVVAALNVAAERIDQPVCNMGHIVWRALEFAFRQRSVFGHAGDDCVIPTVRHCRSSRS